MRGTMAVREHVVNLVNALTNLSPSRSIISQLILLLPEELPIIERSYPEAASSGAREVFRSMGISFGEKVERSKDGFAETVYKLVHGVHDWLDDEQTRSCLAKLAGYPVDSLPNPYLEWVKLVLEKLSQLYDESKVLRILGRLISSTSFRREDFERLLDELRAESGATPAEFSEIVSSAVRREEELLRKEVGRYYNVYVHLVHSRYHLDFLLRRSDVHGDYYYVVHRESLRRALEEVITRRGMKGDARGG